MLSPAFLCKGPQAGGVPGGCRRLALFLEIPPSRTDSKSRLTTDAQGLIQEFDELDLQ
jgi:hypothetical protein